METENHSRVVVPSLTAQESHTRSFARAPLLGPCPEASG